MPKLEPPEGYYTLSEAMRILAPRGFTEGMLYSSVRSGTLRRVVPQGRKQGYYLKDEIDRLAQSVVVSVDRSGQSRARLRITPQLEVALPADLPAIHELVASVAGGEAHAVPVSVLQAWLRHNPESIFVLRADGVVYGYVALFPLAHETLMNRLSGVYLNRTIPIEDIRQYDGHQRALYIAELAVRHAPEHLKNNEPDPENPDPAARLWAMILLRKIAVLVRDIRRHGDPIETLYARATSSAGIDLCRSLGMQEMDLQGAVDENRVPFVFNRDIAARSHSHLARWVFA